MSETTVRRLAAKTETELYQETVRAMANDELRETVRDAQGSRYNLASYLFATAELARREEAA